MYFTPVLWKFTRERTELNVKTLWMGGGFGGWGVLARGPAAVSGEMRRLKKLSQKKRRPSAAEAALDWYQFTARLKSRPFKTAAFSAPSKGEGLHSTLRKCAKDGVPGDKTEHLSGMERV